MGELTSGEGIDPDDAFSSVPYEKVLLPTLISQKEFIKAFCKSGSPHKSVNLSFIVTNIKNKLTDLCGN